MLLPLALNLRSAFATLADAVCTVKASLLTLKASGVVAAFWSFFAAEKGLSPCGYEREKIYCCYILDKYPTQLSVSLNFSTQISKQGKFVIRQHLFLLSAVHDISVKMQLSFLAKRNIP